MRARATAGAALISGGLVLLLAALVPWVPPLQGITDQRPGDAYAPYTVAGLVLVVAGAAALGLGPVGARRHGVLVAVLVPLGIGAGVLVAAGPQLLAPAQPAPEIARLLAIAVPGALMLAPVVVAVILAPAVAAPSVQAPARMVERHAGYLLLAVLAAFGATVALGMAQAAPFGWDESVYALLGRHWLEGTPETGWGPHRPFGMSLLGLGPLLADGADWQLRLVGLLFGLGLVSATWFLARSMGGWAAALLAAAAVAGSHAIAFDSGLFLNDVPSAAVLVLATAVAWRAIERPGPLGRSLLWLAPLAAAAFYLRYGSAVAIAGLALAAVAIWPRRLASAWRLVAVTAGLLAALLVPHLVFSVVSTGSPLGILTSGQQAAAGSAPGLLEYLDAFAGPLAGLVPAGLIVLGLGGAAFAVARSITRGSVDSRTRAILLLVVAAVFQVVVLGLTIHAEPRYIYYAVVLLVVAGCIVLTDAARRRGRVGQLALAAVAACVVASMAVNLLVVPDLARQRLRDWGWEREVGRLIAELAPDGDCGVLVDSVPQTTWYSGCAAVTYGDRRTADRDRLLSAEHRFLVVRSDPASQPPPDVLEAYLSRVEPEPVAVVHDGHGEEVARVYRFRD